MSEGTGSNHVVICSVCNNTKRILDKEFGGWEKCWACNANSEPTAKQDEFEKLKRDLAKTYKIADEYLLNNLIEDYKPKLKAQILKEDRFGAYKEYVKELRRTHAGLSVVSATILTFENDVLSKREKGVEKDG